MEARLVGTASSSFFSCGKLHLEPLLPLQNRHKSVNLSMTHLKPKTLGDAIHLNSIYLNSEVRKNDKIKIVYFLPESPVRDC